MELAFEILLGIGCLLFCVSISLHILSGVPRYMDDSEVKKRFSGKKLKYYELAVKISVVSLIFLILSLICKLVLR